MKTGDLLQWREDVWWMSYIWFWRLVTQSKVNHSSMVLRLQQYEEFEKRRFTTESRKHGTVLNRLSSRLRQYDGEVWWYPLKDDWDPHRQKIGEEMLERIGISYNIAGVVKLTLRRLFGAKCRKVFNNRTVLKGIVGWMNRVDKKNEVFCSEYCYWVYGSTGYLTAGLSDLPLPDDMLKLGIFKEGVKIL